MKKLLAAALVTGMLATPALADVKQYKSVVNKQADRANKTCGLVCEVVVGVAVGVVVSPLIVLPNK